VQIPLAGIQAPRTESFEGVIEVDVPGGLFPGNMYGAPPAGTVFPSGLKFVSPDPNPSTGTELVIGDFQTGTGGGEYLLVNNGLVDSPANLRTGSAFAGGGIYRKQFEFVFEFPTPVKSFGLYASAALGFVQDGTISLTSIDFNDTPIETITESN
jgi:hypothetical protein